MRERIRPLTSQGGVEGFNRKNTTLCINPLHWILRIHRKRMVMQTLKEVVYLLQLPIIQLSNEPRIPDTTIPSISHPSIFGRSYRKMVWESIPQQLIPTPSILPKLHHVPRTNLKMRSNFENLPSVFYCLPNWMYKRMYRRLENPSKLKNQQEEKKGQVTKNRKAIIAAHEHRV